MTRCLYTGRPIREPKRDQRFLPNQRAKYHAFKRTIGEIVMFALTTPGASKSLMEWYEAERARLGAQEGVYAGEGAE